MSNRLTAKQWSDYWKNRTVTSFHGHFQNNYDGPVKRYWENIFAKLPQGANILDLATGNGALALLAQDYSRKHQRDFHVTGIDYAEIKPAEYLSDKEELAQLAGQIEFISGQPMEHTGLPANHYQLVMSQFGFEYGETATATTEVMRLLDRDVGIFAAMMHHTDSAILQQAKESMRQINHCNKSGLLEIAEDLIRLQKALQVNSELNQEQQLEARSLHSSFSQGLSRLGKFARELKDPGHVNLFARTLMSLFDRKQADNLTPADRSKAINHLKAESEAFRLRLADLRSAALEQKEFENLARLLERKGLQGELMAPLQYGGSFFCMAVMAQRPPSE